MAIGDLGEPFALSDRQESMLAALELTCGNVTQAALLSGVAASTHYHWTDTCPEYQERLNLLKRLKVSALEAEADRRAMEGVKRLKFHQGQAIVDPETGKPYEEREYSDGLLIMRLKALDPEKYRERHDIRTSRDDDELDEQFAKLVEEIAARRQAETPGALVCDHQPQADPTQSHTGGLLPE